MTKLHEITLQHLEQETEQLRELAKKQYKQYVTSKYTALELEYQRRYNCTLASIEFNLKRITNIHRLYE